MAAAAFKPVSLLPLVSDEILEPAKEEGAKPALALISAAQPIALEQVMKKLLYQVLRVFGSLSSASQISIQWIPVGPAQPLECSLRFARWRRSGCEDKTPVCRGENRGRRGDRNWGFHNPVCPRSIYFSERRSGFQSKNAR
jgi:hypothetical protein